MAWKRSNRAESLLVGILTFYILWSFLSGLNFFYNGAVTSIFINFGVIFNLIPFLTILLCAAKDNTCISTSNFRYATVFAISFLSIFIFLLLFRSYTDIGIAVCALNGATLIATNDYIKIRCFNVFVKIVSLLLLVAVVEYVLFVFWGKGISVAYVYRETDSQEFNQLLFNFINAKEIFPRFQSLCEEPGVVGTISGLLLFVLRGDKQHRWQYIVFLISGLLSFSLAFYVLLAFHILTSRIKLRYLILIVALVSILYFFFKDYVDFLIISRVDQDSIGAIDNRASDILDTKIASAWSSGQLWFGHGDLSFMHGEDAGSGAKVYLWQYGIIGVLLLFFSYTYYYVGKIKSLSSSLWNCTLFFIVLWISFYQRQWIYHLDYMIIIMSVPLVFSSYYNAEKSVKMA